MTIITRRAALAGLASLSAPAAAGNALARPAETSAQKCIRLAEELSHALVDLDGGNWQFRVSPLFEGKPNVHCEPIAWHGATSTPPRAAVRAERHWRAFCEALEAMTPEQSDCRMQIFGGHYHQRGFASFRVDLLRTRLERVHREMTIPVERTVREIALHEHGWSDELIEADRSIEFAS